ncbi:MAG: energy transducer TonB [Myxococcales bacterium]|nr:energy transducer TonB [Myxococcales bacterium]
MHRRDERSTFVVVVAMLLASLLLHLVLWPLGEQLVKLAWTAPPAPPQEGWLQVQLEDDEPEEPEAPPREEPPKGKIIKQDRVRKEEVPDADKYLSEFDQRVEHETRAPTGRPKAGAAPTQRGTAPDADNMPRAPNLLDPRPNQPKESPDSPGEADEGRGDPALPKVPNPRSLLPTRPDFGPSGRPGVRGNPSQDMAGDEPGQPGTFEDIDADEGDSNQLNSKRYKYASFFNRVKEQVAQHWKPEAIHATRDPDGSRFGTGVRVTQLLVRLNPDGSLKQVKVGRAADLDFLDEEAIRAMRTAQPFPNPPPGLVDPETGFIDFTFGFIFEVESGRGRLVPPKRYRN